MYKINRVHYFHSGGGAYRDSSREFKDKIEKYGPIWFHATRTSIFPSFKKFGAKLQSGGQLRELGLVPLTGEAKGSFGMGPNEHRISGYTNPEELMNSMNTYTQYGRDFNTVKLSQDFSRLIEMITNIEDEIQNLPRNIMAFIVPIARISYFLKPDKWSVYQNLLKSRKDQLMSYYFGQADEFVKKIYNIINDREKGINYEGLVNKYKLKDFLGNYVPSENISFDKLLGNVKDIALMKISNDYIAKEFMKTMLSNLISYKINNSLDSSKKKQLQDIMKQNEIPVNKAKQALTNLIEKPPIINYSEEDLQVIKESKPIIFGFNDVKLLSKMENIMGNKQNIYEIMYGERLLPAPIDLEKYLKFVIVNCADIPYVTDILDKYNLKGVDILCDINLSCKEFYR